MPSDVVDVFLEDLTTHMTPQSPITTLLTTTLLQQGANAKLAIGLGVPAAIIISTVVILSVSVCIICAVYRRKYKR